MELLKAFTLSLGELEQPVVTSYRMGLILHTLYKQKSYKGNSLGKLQKDYAQVADLNRLISKLVENGVLDTIQGMPHHVYRLLGRSQDSVEDIACVIDPFAYVSHLSAMAHHGLTDHLPSKLFISSPDTKQWKEFALKRMESDLGDDFASYCESMLPQLTRLDFKKIQRTDVHRFSSVHWGAYKNIKDRSMRVSTIGRTFLDMLKNPELCGGIQHVLVVYDGHAEKYLRLITDEINQHGNNVDKVRAGYILDERLGLKNEVVESWAQFAQRGGSRKLDSSAEYHSVFSDKWCLSLNVFENVKGA